MDVGPVLTVVVLAVYVFLLLYANAKVDAQEDVWPKGETKLSARLLRVVKPVVSAMGLTIIGRPLLLWRFYFVCCSDSSWNCRPR
jgi:hypothetical protein